MMNVMATVDPRAVVPQLFTGFLLRRAYLVTRQQAEACVDEDANLRDFPVMTLVDTVGAMSQRRLGELMNLDRTTIGKLVDALEAKGWLARERDPRDRRSYALRLTAEGRTALAALQESLDRGEASLVRRLSGEERKRLLDELRDLLAGDATVDIEGLGDRCGYLIARAHHAMFRRATDALRPLGLTPRDLGLLSALSSAQPCSQQRLAAIMGISAPAVLAFIDELEGSGLVVRRRNPSDRRAYDLTLTSAGTAKLTAARVVALDLQADVAKTLGVDVDEDLRGLLSKVIGAPALSASAEIAQGLAGDRAHTVDLAAS
jgi:DNA-binding MarR family transcriptional regulator